MAVESYASQLEPENGDVAIGRFMNMHKFRDLMTTGELYFRRADLFEDENEGLPPEEYLPRLIGLDRHIGALAQYSRKLLH